MVMWRAPIGMSNTFSIPNKKRHKSSGENFLGPKATIIELIMTGSSFHQTYTVHFGVLSERELHSATVGVIPFAHSTFVLFFIRTHLLVTAYVLQERAEAVTVDQT